MAIKAYIYNNPDALPGSFMVEPVDSAQDNDLRLSKVIQEVMELAWTRQFRGKFTAEEIALTVDGRDPTKVAAQHQRLMASGSEPGGATFVIAASHEAHGMPQAEKYISGVGKALEVPRRHLRPALADLSNVFVRPVSQRCGVGTAILRSLCDRFPGDMSTAVYDFPFNSKTVATLGRLGFSKKKTWKEEYFGRKVDQTWFAGPPVGELVETIEDRYRWLRGRQPATTR